MNHCDTRRALRPRTEPLSRLPRRLAGALRLAALAAGLALGLAASRGQAQEIWHYAPYRMRVWVAMERDFELTDALREEIDRRLSDRAWAVAGAVWDLHVQPIPESVEAHALAGLDLVDASLVLEADPPAIEELQKILLVRVARDPGGWRVQAREFDCLTRVWGPVAEKIAAHRALIGDCVFDAVHEAFSPMIFIDKGRPTELKARLRGGGLAAESPRLVDNSPGRVMPGSVFRPVIRRNDRQGRLMQGGLEEVAWSYVIVKSNDRGLLECELLSGIRNALSGRASRRTLRIGLGISPPPAPTRLFLQSRDPSHRPLAGYDVFERPSMDSDEMLFVGRTDWRGLVEVPPGEKTVRMLYLKHGQQILARLPVAPGLHKELVANVVDDGARLEAEGFVKGVQATAVDLVAQQQVLAVRIRKALQEKKLDAAQALLDEFRSLPTRDDLYRRLDQEQKDQLAAAVDEYTRIKINELFGDTRKTMDKLMPPSTMNLASQLSQEVIAARRGG